MSARRALLSIVSLFLVAACGSSSPEEPDAPLATWQGTWQAAEPLFLDDAADAAYQAIHDLRPEYSADEIEALFVGTADVDYTSLRVGLDSLTFLDGGTVVCAGRYRNSGSPDGGLLAGPESYYDFALVEQTAGDCGSYETVSITGPLPEDGEVHFHIVTGTSAGRLRPPPWNPSVWTPTTTGAWFAQRFQAAAPAIAGSLPAR